MKFLRRHNLSDLILRETPGGPGGGGTTTTPPPTAPPSAPATTAPPPAQTASPGTQSTGPTIEQLQAQLAHSNSELDKARKEAAGYRTGNRGAMAEAAKLLAAASGVELPPDAPPDLTTQVKQLIERDKARDARMRQLEIDNTLKDVLVKHGVDHDMTRAMLAAQGTLNDLDPHVDGFVKTLDDAVKKLVTDKPNLKVATTPAPPTRTSAPMTPGQNQTPQLSREELTAMKAEEVAEALKKGQLDEVLGRRPRAS